MSFWLGRLRVVRELVKLRMNIFWCFGLIQNPRVCLDGCDILEAFNGCPPTILGSYIIGKVLE